MAEDDYTPPVKKRRRRKKMTDERLASRLRQYIHQSINDEDSEISAVREEVYNRYVGKHYGTEREGYSQFLSREVLETIEWIKPNLLGALCGSDRVVTFEPVGPEDEPLAEQESDLIHHILSNSNNGDGFMARHDFITDALMFPNAYAKINMEEPTDDMEHMSEGITEDALLEMQNDAQVEIVSIAERVEEVTVEMPDPLNPQAPPSPQVVPLPLYDVTYRSVSGPQLMLTSVPPEDVMIDPDLTSLDLDKARFVIVRTDKTYSELVKMGYPRYKLDKIGHTDRFKYGDEETNRRYVEDEDPHYAENLDDQSIRKIEVYECYVWIDYENTGVAQFRRIVMAGNQIFENERTDYQPIVAMSTIKIPHRHIGMSLGEIVLELQKLQTTLARELLDNIYRINNNRKFFDESGVTVDGGTIDAMLDPQTEWIPMDGDPKAMILPDQTNSVVGEILPVMDWTKNAVSMRSGVAPENNIDPAVLQNTTHGALMGAMEKANERVEMIIRIMAETGFKQIYRKAHQLLRKYPDVASAIKMRGEWISVNPAEWKNRTDVSVNVSGFKNKEQMILLFTQLVQMQMQAMEMGLANPEKLYNTAKKIVEAMGAGHVQQFFVDPNSAEYQPPPPPPPDPQLIKAEAEAKHLEREDERHDSELQLRYENENLKFQLDTQKTQHDAMIATLNQEIDQLKQGLEERKQGNEEYKTEAEVILKAAQATLAQAQAVKAMSDAEKSDADTGKVDAETEKIEAASVSDMYGSNDSPSENSQN